MTASYGFDTLQIHAGARPDPATGARQTPIYQTTAYVFRDADHAAALFNLQEVGFIYSRLTNPTVAVLQERIATLEGGVGAVCCSSGHAAQIMALFPLMAPGRNIVASTRLYGGTVTQFSQTIKRFGWSARFVDFDDPDAMKPPSTTTRGRSSAKPSPIPAATSPIFRPSPGSPMTRACR
jgi:O-acetylhomoserine (thiol)-lyase